MFSDVHYDIFQSSECLKGLSHIDFLEIETLDDDPQYKDCKKQCEDEIKKGKVYSLMDMIIKKPEKDTVDPLKLLAKGKVNDTKISDYETV